MTSKGLIDSFTKIARNDHLSNFYPSTIYLDGKKYSTVEHAYWAYSTLDIKIREDIRQCAKPGDARRLAKTIEKREDWSEFQIPHLRKILKMKFENPLLMPLLVQTGDAELVFKNTWGDTLLGVCKGVGENWLGRILMELREQLPKKVKEEYIEFDSK